MDFRAPRATGVNSTPLPWQISEVSLHNTASDGTQVPAQQRSKGLSTGQEEDSRFETLVSAACSATFGEDPLGVMGLDFMMSSTPTQGNLLDFAALDFVGTLSSAPVQENLDFAGPLSSVPVEENVLDMTALDFAGPLSSAST